MQANNFGKTVVIFGAMKTNKTCSYRTVAENLQALKMADIFDLTSFGNYWNFLLKEIEIVTNNSMFGSETAMQK